MADLLFLVLWTVFATMQMDTFAAAMESGDRKRATRCLARAALWALLALYHAYKVYTQMS